MIQKDYSFGVVPLKKDEEGVKVLIIVHKGGKHWGFPKGHKDEGETDFETAKRELKEETGLSLHRCLNQIPYVETYNFYRFKDKVHKTVTYFPCLVEGDLCLQQEEVLDARWILLSDARKYLTFKEAKEICKKVEEFLLAEPL